MKTKSITTMLVLLVALLAASCSSSSDSAERKAQLVQSIQDTLQAGQLQSTIQAQSAQLTSIVAALAVPPTNPPAQLPEELPQATDLPLPPALPQATLPPPPTANTRPTIRTGAETKCWYIITTNPADDKLLDRIPAGQELPILYKAMIRKDETYPWVLNAVKVKTERGCACWVKAKEVEISGDLSKVTDATFVFTDLNILFGSCP